MKGKGIALVVSVLVHAAVLVWLPDGEPTPREPVEPLPEHVPIEVFELPPSTAEPEAIVSEPKPTEPEPEPAEPEPAEAEPTEPEPTEPEPTEPKPVQPEPKPAEPKASPPNPPPAPPAEPPTAPDAAAPDPTTPAAAAAQSPATPRARPRSLDLTLSNRSGRRGAAGRGGRGAGGRSGAAPAASRCTSAVTKPRPRKRVPMAYSRAARKAELEGRLVLRAQVDARGRVSDVTVLQGLGAPIDDPAVAAFRAWTFEPAMACGEPVSGQFTIARDYSLGD